MNFHLGLSVSTLTPPYLKVLILKKIMFWMMQPLSCGGYKTVWPNTNVHREVDLTLKYNGLHKIALSNWYPIKHVITLSYEFSTLLFDIGTGAPVHLGKIFFDLIVSHWCKNNMSYKLPFPVLIFGLFEIQKPLQEPSEFLSALVQLYVFRIKKKGD